MFDLVCLACLVVLPGHSESRLQGDLWSRALGFLIFGTSFVLHSIASVNISYQLRPSLISLAVLLLEKCVLEQERKNCAFSMSWKAVGDRQCKRQTTNPLSTQPYARSTNHRLRSSKNRILRPACTLVQSLSTMSSRWGWSL